jgi:hypothetical protein
MTRLALAALTALWAAHRIYRINGIREMNGLNSVANGMVYAETLCDLARLCLISWDSRGLTV